MTSLPSRLVPGIAQAGKFGLVGLANTAIDFAITNVFGLLLASRDPVSVILIAAAGCLAASLNSYALNRRWTFRDAASRADHRTFVRFLGMAGVGLLVNTSVCMFCHRQLLSIPGMPDLAALNIAKLGGVAVAMSVTFIGYRFGVFQHEGILAFRESFRLVPTERSLVLAQVTAVSVAAVVVRAAYLFFTTAIFGDAVNYAWVARGIAEFRCGDVDPFWSSLYCFWQAGLLALGFKPVVAALLASFLPGVLLVPVITWITRSLYGSTASWAAGLLCCVHPRLVEYSCNGYAEAFYLLALTIGVGFLTRTIQRNSLLAAIGWGAAFGLYACVRNEGSLFLLATLPLSFFAAPKLRRRLLLSGTAAAAFAAVVVAYAAVSLTMLGTAGVFQKSANLAKQYSEQLDVRDAARETYGQVGAMFGSTRPTVAPSWSTRAAIFLHRYPRNLGYTLQRLPGVLLSPLPVFGMLLPIIVVRRGRVRGDEWPLLLMLVFPLAFYPCIQVEPRLLFPLLVPMHVFGAAGLVAVCCYLAPERRRKQLLGLFVFGMVAMGTGLSVWRAEQMEKAYRPHRELADFLAAHAAPGERIVGCGYGNVSTTAFLAGHPAMPRLWTANPAALAPFVADRHCRWLVLYESFLRDANPELLGVLDQGVPGFRRACDVAGAQGRRCQIYVLEEKP